MNQELELPVPPEDYLARQGVAHELIGPSMTCWSMHKDSCPATCGGACECGLVLCFRSSRQIAAVDAGLAWEVKPMH